jgi:hypothetical protein
VGLRPGRADGRRTGLLMTEHEGIAWVRVTEVDLAVVARQIVPAALAASRATQHRFSGPLSPGAFTRFPLALTRTWTMALESRTMVPSLRRLSAKVPS